MTPYSPELFKVDMDRFVEMGILFQIKQIAARREDLDERQTDQLVCEPVWQTIEQDPESERDFRQVLGNGSSIPKLIIDCTYPGRGGGYLGFPISVFDEELGLDSAQILQIEEWASEKEQQIIRL